MRASYRWPSLFLVMLSVVSTIRGQICKNRRYRWTFLSKSIIGPKLMYLGSAGHNVYLPKYLVEERSLTRGPRESLMRPVNIRKMKILKWILSQWVYFSKILSFNSIFFLIFIMRPARPCFQAHTAHKTLWVWDPCSRRCHKKQLDKCHFLF